MKKIFLTSSAIAALTVSGFAFASMGKSYEGMQKCMEMKEMPVQHETMQKAIEANDFTAFQTAVKDSPMAVVDTQAEFDQMVAMHTKMKTVREEMKALHATLGLPEMKEMKHDMKDQKREAKKDKKKELKAKLLQWKEQKLKKEQKELVKSIILNGVYEDFVTAMPKNHPLLSYVTVENFSTLKSLLNAKVTGNLKNVKSLATELGMDKKELKYLRRMFP